APASLKGVRWPPYMVAEDHVTVLSCGAFDREGSVPLEFLAQKEPRVPQPPSQLRDGIAGSSAEERHAKARQLAQEGFQSYWVELAAPDFRPYFYDYVSHTWTFSRPEDLLVLAGQLWSEGDVCLRPKPHQAADGFSLGVPLSDLQARLREALFSPLPETALPPGAVGPTA
ncbi:unnamed protein product, partial [Polarella glacialis]